MSLQLQSDTSIDEMFCYLRTQVEGQAVWQPDKGSNQGLKNHKLAKLTAFAFNLVSYQWNKQSCYNGWQDPVQEHKRHVCLKGEEETSNHSKFLHPVW